MDVSILNVSEYKQIRRQVAYAIAFSHDEISPDVDAHLTEAEALMDEGYIDIEPLRARL